MAKPNTTIIDITSTFQDWVNQSNEMANIFKDSALTASSGDGDTTSGNATLNGDFTATNITVSNTINTNSLSSAGESSINIDVPVTIESPSQNSITFSNASGGRTQYSSTNLTWDVGIHNATNNNFIINTGSGGFKLTLTPSGKLTVPSLEVLGETTLGLTTADVSEDSGSLYFTDERATTAAQSAFVAGNNVTFGTDSNGKITVNAQAQSSDASTLDGLNSSQFLRNDQDGTLNGNLIVNGDITTNSSASDISIKENIEVINDALLKVDHLNGITFNYIDDPGTRMTGLIAQHVEEVLPEAVYTYDVDENGKEIKAVRYGNVVGLLVEAIKELKDKIEVLESNK